MEQSAWDHHWMQEALKQAEQAAESGEVPVGAVLVDANNQCIAQAHNAPIAHCDASAHAEIEVMRKAGVIKQNYRLLETTLYVTLEPCLMCLGAMVHARIKRVVFAAHDPKTGCLTSQAKGADWPWLNHRLTWQGGVCQSEASALLKAFFSQQRKASMKHQSLSGE